LSVTKKLLSQTALYGLSSIVGRVLNYLLVPLYTAVFAPAEYGIVTELYSYVAFLNVVFTYGMETAYFRFAHQPGADRRLLYRRVLTMLLLTSTLGATIITLSADTIAAWLHYPGQGRYVMWLGWGLAIDAIVAVPFARLRLENRAARFATLRLLNIVLILIASWFFIVVAPTVLPPGSALHGRGQEAWLQALVAAVYDPTLGVGYVFLIGLCANALWLPLLWPQLRDWRPSLSPATTRMLLIYSIPLLVAGLAGMVNEVMDRLLLKRWLPIGFYPGLTNAGALGVYGACYKLSIFMSLVIQAFRYAAEPFFFGQAADKNSPRTFALVMKWFVIACCLIFLVISLFLADFGLLLRSPVYRSGLAVVPILLLANLFLGVYINASIWFKLTDRTRIGTYIAVGGAVLTVALNWLLIPRLGYIGCAWTTLACYASMAITCLILGQRYYPIPYAIGRIGAYLALAVGLVVLAGYVGPAGWWAERAWHAALVLAFLGVVAVAERRTWQRPVRA
jgi:O-antigen/teichoic acid export membrane protein